MNQAMTDALTIRGGEKLAKVLLDITDRGVDLSVRLEDLPHPDGPTLYIASSCWNRQAGLPTPDERGRLVAAMWSGLRLQLDQHCGCGQHMQDRFFLLVDMKQFK